MLIKYMPVIAMFVWFTAKSALKNENQSKTVFETEWTETKTHGQNHINSNQTRGHALILSWIRIVRIQQLTVNQKLFLQMLYGTRMSPFSSDIIIHFPLLDAETGILCDDGLIKLTAKWHTNHNSNKIINIESLRLNSKSIEFFIDAYSSEAFFRSIHG